MRSSNQKQSFNEQPFKILKDERFQQLGSLGSQSIGISNIMDKLQCIESNLIQTNDGFALGNEANMNFKKKDEKYKLKHNEKIVLQENWLANNIKREQGIEKQENNYKTEYDQVSFAYANDLYTYQANIYIKKIASDRHASEIACKYPLYTMMKAISKKFLFNELEIIFFAYILEENKWALSDEKLREHSFQMQDFLNINEAKDPLEYKCLLLYLVLNAYAVKYYLNPQEDMDMFSKHLDQIVGPFFKELFSYWSKKGYGSNSLKINPKKLNQIFRKLSAKPTDQNKKNQEDYNSLVDAIIQISPPYNNGKYEEKVGMKNEQKTETNQIPQLQQMNQSIEDNRFSLYPSINLYQKQTGQDYPFQYTNSTDNYNILQDKMSIGGRGMNSQKMNDLQSVPLLKGMSLRADEIGLPLINQQSSFRSDNMEAQIQRNNDFNLNRSSGDQQSSKIIQSFNLEQQNLMNSYSQFLQIKNNLLQNQSPSENDNNNMQSITQSMLFSKYQSEMLPKKPLNSSLIKQEDSALKNKGQDKIYEEELPPINALRSEASFVMDELMLKKFDSYYSQLNDKQ